MEIANDGHEEVKGYRKLYLVVNQPEGRVETTTLHRGGLVPILRRDML